MTQPRRKAEESWDYYRSAFGRRSQSFPDLAVFVPLIDRIRELGYSSRLYGGASLDNLVISVHPKPRDRRQTILVVPRTDTVEFRFYRKDGEAEVSTVARDQAASALDRLLPRLAAEDRTSTSGTADDDSQA
jgi:hypothetical protein